MNSQSKQDSIQSKYSRICAVVERIPYGKVASYGQIAALAGLPRHARMVSKAMSQFDGELPWHRVLKSDGKIAFDESSQYASIQRNKLQEEGVAVIGLKVDLDVDGWRPDFLS